MNIKRFGADDKVGSELCIVRKPTTSNLRFQSAISRHVDESQPLSQLHRIAKLRLVITRKLITGGKRRTLVSDRSQKGERVHEVMKIIERHSAATFQRQCEVECNEMRGRDHALQNNGS